MLLSNFITKKQLKRIILFLKKRLYFSVFIGRFTKKRVIYTSIPKAGTNLLFNLLNEIPYYRFVIKRGLRPWLFDDDAKYVEAFKEIKKGSILRGHAPFRKDFKKFINRYNGYEVILLVRDPRDVITSTYHYLLKMDKTHKSHIYFSSLKDRNEKISKIVFGEKNFFEPMKKIYEEYLDWQSLDNCLTIKYEELIDIKNGKLNPDKLFGSLKKLLQFNMSNNDLLNALIDDSNSFTIRKGTYGDWRNFFNDKQKAIINDEFRDILIRLGYEEN